MALSPMMQQYFEIKEEYKDCIVFYRLGDFYEMFFDDAILASRELELTLTGRDCGLENRAPMCGVPYHSCEVYINRLISKGYKVAICEQTSNPAESKGLVTREIIRVITPGTVTDSKFLDESKNNFIASVYLSETDAAAVFADISTGDLHICNPKTNMKSGIKNELARFSPAEVVCGGDLGTELSGFIQDRLHCMLTVRDSSEFEHHRAKQMVEGHFNKSIEQMGLSENNAAIAALGGLLSYLYATQYSTLEHLTRLDIYSGARFMELNIVTRRNLELCETMREKKKQGSLLGVLDKTKTAMGGRLIRSWIEQPLTDAALINMRLDAVEDLKANYEIRMRLIDYLAKVYDIERLMTKVVYNTAGGRELLSLADTLSVIPDIKQTMSCLKAPYIVSFEKTLNPLESLCALIKSAVMEDCPVSIREGGIIKLGFSKEVDELRSLLTNSHGILSELEQSERTKTGIRTLKIGYNKVFGYYIEVSKSFINQVPEHYIRRQTLANCERYITGELKELENSILGASDKSAALEYELFCDVRRQVSDKLRQIQQNAYALSHIDVLVSLADVADKNSYSKPILDNGEIIEIKGGRHPVVEKMLGTNMFVPNDTYLDNDDSRLMIITGPNMAGKSTYMRQIALITLMAQMGSFVPAESAHIGIVDKIFTRVGASDDLATGQSTFMLEMNEVAEILSSATRKSLIIYDEIGRGTSTFDGMSIARAVLEHTANKSGIGAKTVFATHYHELTALAGTVDGVKNYQTAVKKRGDDIVFLRKIISGATDDSYGIEVAKLAGLPEDIINNAKSILKSIEQNKVVHNKKEKSDHLEQLSLAGSLPYELYEQLREIEVEVLTPIEGLNVLYKLANRAKEG